MTLYSMCSVNDKQFYVRSGAAQLTMIATHICMCTPAGMSISESCLCIITDEDGSPVCTRLNGRFVPTT